MAFHLASPVATLWAWCLLRCRLRTSNWRSRGSKRRFSASPSSAGAVALVKQCGWWMRESAVQYCFDSSINMRAAGHLRFGRTSPPNCEPVVVREPQRLVAGPERHHNKCLLVVLRLANGDRKAPTCASLAHRHTLPSWRTHGWCVSLRPDRCCGGSLGVPSCRPGRRCPRQYAGPSCGSCSSIVHGAACSGGGGELG